MISSRITDSFGLVTIGALAALVFFSASCATTVASKRPGWVEVGQHNDYPDRRFIMAVGQGDTREKAADRARAGISKRFSVSVEAKTVVIESTWILNSGGVVKESSRAQVRDGVATSSAMQLEDLAIAETWFDKKNAQYYSLAVLNRTKAFDRVENAIIVILEDVEAVMKLAEAETDHLRKAGRWATAIRIFSALEPYIVQARVLKPNWSPEYPSDASEGRLRRSFEKAAGQVSVFIQVGPEDTDLTERMYNAFQNVITAAGMVSVRDESDATVRLLVDLTSRDSGRTASGYRFTEIEAAVSIFLSGDQVFASTTRKVREGGLDTRQARSTAENWIIKDINNGFMGFLYQSVLK